jgi:hypothetical protein
MKNVISPPAAKLEMMKASIRCLVLGLMSLLPIIGVGYALPGLWYSFVARRHERYFWNPAKPHRILGLICASFGALVWGAVDTILIYNICNNQINS